MSYNERIFNVLLEAGACHSKKVNKDECVEACESFDDTIGNGHNFSKVTVPSSLKFSEESVPVCKTTKKECGETECGECGDLNEAAYFIDGRVLDMYMMDNNISNDAEAVNNICEHYGIDVDDVYVVVECDEINHGLIDKCKNSYISCGLLKRCDNQIRNCVNAGIKVAKRS